MNQTTPQTEREKNGVPVLERMMEILYALESHPSGESIRSISEQLGVPRSTVYRILNTLDAHEMVQRRLDGSYVLGTRLLKLAASVRVDASFDLVAIATPVLKRLADASLEANKLSIMDSHKVIVIAAFPGQGEYSLQPAVGQTFPLHAGAASKLLLANLDQAAIEQALLAPLKKYTPQTINDPDQLRAELEQIRSRGWASDHAEHGGSVCAVAAPVTDPNGKVIAALSIPYFADKDAEHRDRFIEMARAAAREISGRIANH